ncbi:hypothetical protein L226DRAFT_565633 [Lentinus tigrinus ALCF2SS1-7]|uniref:DH domain-containing protein n=1 Tax=Lentinus tigrinus ALCF2SS1-6 TaxID=1328759 RepID=A0A5C2ST85_9APHY|nr:hypothetical protein L227DRAFT_605293 [Lentinus tigrinus ALCF2SS1-6]RPD80796.1 hypothetical protein L226DRAFT_565633 [Lentinus tigrinus ALCF2SS1-7]
MSAAINVLPQRPSLLDRRASNNVPDVPDHLSVADLVAHTPQPSSNPLVSRGNSRRPSAGYLPFVPLTPIMASPLLTPEVAHASPAAVFECAARQVLPGHAHQQGDYITHHPSPPNPTWTTSPPTPPPKHPSSPRLAPSTPPSPARAIRRRSRSRSRNPNATRAGSRPASVSHFVPSSLSHSSSPASSSTAPNSPAQSDLVPARRMSLPSDLSKPLPPRPDERTDGALTNLSPDSVRCASALIDTDLGATLLPSLSRRTPTTRARGASLGSDADETGTLRSVGKKLFNLEADEGDLSDDEDPDQRVYKEDSTPARGQRDPDPDMGQTRVREQEKEKAERLRQYHALRELLTTEVGYLLDLRALVTVYLDQLLLLSTPPTTPPMTVVPPLPTPPIAPPLCIGVLPPPTRTLPSFSALSIPSFFPSSRSSYIQPSPLPTPSPSVSESLSSTLPDDGSPQDRERQPSGASSTSRERQRDREDSDRIPTPKSSKSRSHGPMLIEREVRAVCRNAQELLKFHERFVGELRKAVDVSGVQGAFPQSGQELPEYRSGEVFVTERVEHALEVVAAKFVNEAGSFSIYEAFCPGHTAAVDLVRRVQERWPTAWDAYEQRCASLVLDSSLICDDDIDPEVSSPTSPVSEAEDAPDAERYRKRRYSTPALSFAISASTTAAPSARTELPFPTSAITPITTALPTVSKGVRRSAPKLKFMDYLIKPVQRICKYPLLLDQLQNKRRKRPSEGQIAVDASSEHSTDEAVRGAGEAMRGVVDRVNQASEKEAHNLRSALIASRLSFSTSSVPLSPPAFPPTASAASSSSEGTTSSHSHSNSVSSCSAVSTAPTSPGTISPASIPPTSPTFRPSTLTADFISSLGPCMLAGALDVIQHPSHRAKYLGAFLYVGGYCILAKVSKGGRVYEPRHWFSLSAVEVVDAEEDDASFPYSFRISGYGHHLELAASCSQEKSIWLNAIHDALSVEASWRNEPLSSLQSDDKTPPPAPMVEEPQEYPSGLPTIHSLSELEKQSESNGDAPASAPSKLKYSKTLSRLDGIALKNDPHSQPNTISAALSRRSSTASVKAFFSPMSIDPARIQRVSMQSRAPIDQGLHDVFSESCLAARAQAQMRGEELFLVRTPGSAVGRRQGSGMSRSNSGLSIASAMGLTAAKRKYDMVSRRNRSVDLDMPAPPMTHPPSAVDKTTPTEDGSITTISGSVLTMRGKSLAVRRQKKQPASIAPAISSAIAQMNAERDRQSSRPQVLSPETLSLDSPPDVSHCSSVSSILPSPVDNSPLPIPILGLSPNGTLRQSDVATMHGNGAPPKRARSMVDNVRYFFQPPRSDSPTTSSSSEPDRASPTPPLGASVDNPSPDYSSGIVQWLRRTSLRRRTSTSSPSSSSASIDEQSAERRRPLPTRNSTDGVAVRSSDFLDVSRSHTSRRTGPNPASPKRHRSLFVPSSRSRGRAGFSLRDVHEVPREELLPPPLAPSRSLSTRKSFRNMLLFQRSNALTPLDSPAT